MKLTQHPLYKVARKAVTKNDLVLLRDTLDAFEGFERADMAFRSALWAVTMNQPDCFREALRGARHTELLQKEKSTLVPSLLHAIVEESSQRLSAQSSFEHKAFVGAWVQAGGELEAQRFSHQPLLKAAQSEDVSMVNALLEAGADPDGLYQWTNGASSSASHPPLCSTSSVEVFKALLEGGADAGAQSSAMKSCALWVALTRFAVVDKVPQAIQAWVACGGDALAPLTKDEPDTSSIACLAFFHEVTQPEPEWHESARKMMNGIWAADRQRIFQIQEHLVATGFDLGQPSPFGVTWADLVLMHGSPRLKTMIRLEAIEAPAAPSRRPRV